MSDETPEDNDARESTAALAIWDGEGGAGVAGPQECETRGRRSQSRSGGIKPAALHARIIALENLAVLLLANAPKALRQQARDMAVTILPRPSRTRHSLTITAAARVNGIVDRAIRHNDASDKRER